jgi:hypothetical protein
MSFFYVPFKYFYIKEHFRYMKYGYTQGIVRAKLDAFNNTDFLSIRANGHYRHR